MTTEKPLFIPLKTEYFDAFAAGTKTDEYRRLDQRWNARTCAIGRRVKGYGKAHRLTGTITGFRPCGRDAHPAINSVYPAGGDDFCAITIKVDR
jgi:hypothetical protein